MNEIQFEELLYHLYVIHKGRPGAWETMREGQRHYQELREKEAAEIDKAIMKDMRKRTRPKKPN